MPLQPADIQGNIFPGFKKDHQAYLFVRFPGTPRDALARNWLAQLRPSIAASDEVAAYNALYKVVDAHRPGRASEAIQATWVNVGFSLPGIEKLQPSFATGFPEAFVQGMHNRTNETGDLDDERNSWLIGGSDGQLPDAILVIAADVRTDLDAEITRQRQALADYGLYEMALFDGESLGGGVEHFGFKDNITNPMPVEDVDASLDTDPVPYTEFILQPASLPEPRPPDWTENGSFLVFRRLYQHVARFHERAWSAAAELNALGGGPDGVMLNGPYMEAKFFGRWPNGIPVGVCPMAPAAGSASTEITAANYLDDKPGLKIPRFSHIRKGHPRDLGMQDDGTIPSGADTAQRHRLIRRGIPYGPFLPAGFPDDGVDRGLLFVGYQASLEGQFEFIMQEWMNNRTFPSLSAGLVASDFGDKDPGEDPIIGAQEDDESAQRIIEFPVKVTTGVGSATVSTETVSLKRFVTMTGGGYFFCPGLAALASLSGEFVS